MGLAICLILIAAGFMPLLPMALSKGARSANDWIRIPSKMAAFGSMLGSYLFVNIGPPLHELELISGWDNLTAIYGFIHFAVGVALSLYVVFGDEQPAAADDT